MARKLTVRRAILVAVILGLLVPALIVGVVGERLYYAESLHERTEEDLAQYADTLSLGLQEPLWTFNPSAARKLIEAVMRNAEVCRVDVRDANLGFFTDSEKPERCTGQIFSASRNIYHGDQLLGVVRVEISDTLVLQSVRSKLTTLAVTLMAQIVLAFVLIAFVLERRLVKPLKRIDVEAGRLADGALDTPITPVSDDEIGSVESRLEATRRSLQTLLATLEQKNRLLEADLLERRRAENAAQASELRLRALVEQSPIAIIEIALDGTVEEWNAAAERIFGWKRVWIIGQSITRIFPQNAENGLSELFRLPRDLSSGNRHVSDNVTHDENRITCQWHNTLVRDAAGIPQRIVAMVEDITERRRAEQEITLLARVVSRTTNMVIITDPGWRITWVNDAFTRVTGYTLAEASGKNPGELLRGSVPDASYSRRLKDSLDAKASVRDIELLNYAKDGTPYWVQTEFQPILDERGQLLHYIAVETNITERKQSELRIRESQRMLQMVLDTIPVRVFWKDRDSRFLGCNAEFARDAGTSANVLIGQTDYDQIWRDYAPIYVADDKEVITSGQARLGYEEPRYWPDGSSRWLRTSKVPLRDSNDAIIGVLGVYEDITDRKLAEAALAQSDSRLRALIDYAPFAVLEYLLTDDDHLCLVTANRAADRLFGIDYSVLQGQTLEASFESLRDGELPAALRRVARTGERYTADEVPLQSGGAEQVFEIFAFQTAMRRVAILMREVSDLHRAAKGLRELAQTGDTDTDPKFFAHLAEQFAGAIGAQHAQIVLWEGEQHYVLAANSAAFALMPPSVAATRVRRGEPLLLPDNAREELVDDTQVAELGARGYAGIPIMGAAHTPIGVLSAFFQSPIRNPEMARSLAEVFAVRATTELARQRTLQALRASESKFSLTFHEAPVAMTLSSLETGRFFEVNRAFAELLALPESEIVGHTSIELGMSSTARSEWTRRLLRDGYVSAHPFQLQRRDGVHIDARLWARMLPMSEEPTILVNVVDVTEQLISQRKIEELNRTLEARVEERTRVLAETLERLQLTQNELIQSEKLAALGGLVAGVAHELNTPIGNGLMVASTLRDATGEINRAYAAGIKRSVLEGYLREADGATDILLRNLHRAAELISSFKQVAVDQTSSQRRCFKLDELVAEIVLTLQPMFKKTPFKIASEIPHDIELDSYPGPLGQVIANLLNNALVHGFEGQNAGTISLTAQATGPEQVILTLADDGCGIPAEHLRKIFEPFFTTKRGRHGSGLGLHIVHNIVTGILGGQISVESQLAIGTRFRIALPLVAPHTPDRERDRLQP